MARRSAYEVLDVEVGATRAEVTTAYRRAAMRTHPDRNPDDPQATEKFQEVERAHRLLLKLTPSARPKIPAPAPAPAPSPPQGEAPPATGRADVQAAFSDWRSARDRDEARRRAYEAEREEKVRKREEEVLARNKVSTPAFSLAALVLAAAAVQMFAVPLNLLLFVVFLLAAYVLIPPKPGTYTGIALAMAIKFIVRVCFVGLFLWPLWVEFT